jgi:hypothetical protein
MALRLYFLAYFNRRELTFGELACEVDECVEMRSLTIAETHRRCSSDCDCGGGAIIVYECSIVDGSWTERESRLKSLPPTFSLKV